MSHVKAKKVKIPLGENSDQITDLFNQMVGAGSINMNIVYPKYLRLKIHCENLIKLFEVVAESPFMTRQPEYAKQKASLDGFCKEARADFIVLFARDFTDYINNLNAIDENSKKEFAIEYEAAKKSKLINNWVMMCDRLVNYKNNFNDITKFNHKFIMRMPGVEWCPFPFIDINLKYIFSCANVRENTIGFFMMVLHKAFAHSYALWGELGSPDIDIDEFINVLMMNLTEIQKRPELTRCQKAFKQIAESVGLLKQNFGTYYRDFVDTKDNTIMMQHFIIDVSKNTNNDPQLTAQFRKIVEYYRKIAKDQIQNPKVKALFDKVNESFNELDKTTPNLSSKSQKPPELSPAKTPTAADAAADDSTADTLAIIDSVNAKTIDEVLE
jgi:hypothetical protein